MIYYVYIRKPKANSTIWAGPEHADGIIAAQETDNHRTRREAVATKLEGLSGSKPSWNKRRYHYEAELTTAQAEEIAALYMVQSVVPKKK